MIPAPHTLGRLIKVRFTTTAKKQIMHGFQSEMEEKYSGVASVETLLADVGQPAEVADVLWKLWI